MTLRTAIVLAVLSVGFASPSPKIDDKSSSSLWSNLLKIGEDIEVKSNNNEVVTGRSGSLEQTVETYMKNHDVTLKLPIIGSTVTLGARNLDNGEMDLKLDFGSGEVQARKKSKLKKIFIPILVFILLKAMTLIPLALGVLGLKTWNAIQLSFVSFIAALGMAVYKLCSKLGDDHHHHPQIIHNAWDPHQQYAARGDVVGEQAAQQMAYNSYAPQN